MLQEIRKIIVFYAGMSLLHPDMFLHSQDVKQQGPLVLYNLLMNQSIPDDLFREIINRFKDQKLEELFHPIFSKIYSEIHGKTILEKYNNHLAVLCDEFFRKSKLCSSFSVTVITKIM